MWSSVQSRGQTINMFLLPLKLLVAPRVTGGLGPIILQNTSFQKRNRTAPIKSAPPFRRGRYSRHRYRWAVAREGPGASDLKCRRRPDDGDKKPSPRRDDQFRQPPLQRHIHRRAPGYFSLKRPWAPLVASSRSMIWSFLLLFAAWTVLRTIHPPETEGGHVLPSDLPSRPPLGASALRVRNCMGRRCAMQTRSRGDGEHDDGPPSFGGRGFGGKNA